jgi:hypothetical protein
MKTTKRLACLGSLAVCLALPNVARAADNCSGQWVRVGTTVVGLDDDHNAPSHAAVGVYDASALRTTYKDKDGDAFTNDVSIAGTWRTVSGTGKYADAKASGWSKIIRMAVGPDGGVYIGVWGGECSVR